MTRIETIREYRRDALKGDAGRAAGEAVLVRLATRLHALRDSLGLTQEQLAARAGLDQASISDIENGDANPTVRTLGRLAAGLGVDASALLNHTPLGTRYGYAVQLHEDVKWLGVSTEANRTPVTWSRRQRKEFEKIKPKQAVVPTLREKLGVG